MDIFERISNFLDNSMLNSNGKERKVSILVPIFAVILLGTTNYYFFPPPTHEQFLRNMHGHDIIDGIDYLNTQTPKDAKIMVNLPLTYLIHRTPIYSTTDKNLQPDFDTAMKFIEKNHITYVFIATADVATVDFNDVIGMNLGNPHFSKVYENKRVKIFQVVRADNDGKM
ncbi:MAG: hypothetical protein WC759_00105 [Candidatus Micrarchaeia archaeon]|jgi:hypothetical protein